MADQTKMDAAVRAGCEWANEHMASLGVRGARSRCDYPHCGCRVVPGQIKAAMRNLLVEAGDDLGFTQHPPATPGA